MAAVSDACARRCPGPPGAADDDAGPGDPPRVTADHNSTVELQRPARHALGPALVGQHAGQSAGRVHGWDQPLHFVDGPANNVSLSQSDYYFSSHSRFFRHDRMRCCPDAYRPLRLNSSRCASNQAMTSLRFQRLCLPSL